LKVNKTLKELDLYGNSISDVSALAEALKVNKTLKELDLDGNQLSDAGKASVRAAWKKRSDYLYL